MIPWLTLRLGAAFLVACALALRGVRRGSLAPSGAVAALVVGTITLAADLAFGASLIVFYLTGSAATRLRSEVKARYDLEHRQSGGQRDWTQVVATAGVAAALSLVWIYLFGSAGKQPSLVFASDPGASMLFVAVVSSLAFSCGDTWASELGILAHGDPRLITNCRRVPRGTNGAISALGTASSFVGGGTIGIASLAAMLLTQWVRRSTGVAVSPAQDALSPAWIVPIAAAAGTLGSLLDSILGAVLQRTWQQKSTGKITSRCPRTGERAAFAVVAGYNVLSNEMVNLLASAATAGLTAVCAARVFGGL